MKREENAKADALSKKLEARWTIRTETAVFLCRYFGVAEDQIIMPSFNTVRHFVTRLSVCPPIMPLVLVLPIWPAQCWWPKVLKVASHMVELPGADLCLQALGATQGDFPNWGIAAFLFV